MRLFLVLTALCLSVAAEAEEVSVASPDGSLKVTMNDAAGQLSYRISFDDQPVVLPSRLGLKTSIADLSQGLRIVDNRSAQLSKNYTMTNTKSSSVSLTANTMSVAVENVDGFRFEIEWVVADHDVGFRYVLPRQKDNKYKRMVVEEELTAFLLPGETRTFLCPQIGPETGWERTKPSYEEEYEADAPMRQSSKYGLGYTFPCLLKTPSAWVLIGETGVGSNFCGAHLSDFQEGRGFQIAFPHEGENGGFGSAKPGIPLPGVTPWRTITIDTTLKAIVETTIPYDLVDPLYSPSTSYQPGRYTWSWLIWQDRSINYADQQRFVDLAADMGYEYCLVDNLWDERIGRDSIELLSNYARSKGVSLMLWYNSNGFWNDAPQGPRNLMNTAIAREKEMAWLEKIGVKGIKVDFFGGDKQETMRLYEDILSDANRHGLQVIFHGCTLPRGWERIYPNFVGAEAVLASENVFFTEHHADREAFQLTLHPFVRNAYASMDWGGVIMNHHLSKDNHSRHARKTSDVFEMASGITNQCAINCVAVQPNTVHDLPQFEIDFLRRLPTTWDETRFIEGYPGRYVVMARRHGADWYVAALNATDQPMRLELNLADLFMASDSLLLYADKPRKRGELVPASYSKPLKPNGKGKCFVTLQPRGGAIVVKR